MATPARRWGSKPTLMGRFHSIISIVVGEEGEATFLAHDSLLAGCSPFFAAACRGNFREARERVIRLPDVEPIDFENFMLWMYTQGLGHLAHADIDQHYDALFQLYFVAERLQVRVLRNAIVDTTIALEIASAFVPCADQVRRVFEQTPRGNPLRRLLVDMHAWDVEPKFLLDNEERFTKDFVLELAISAMDCLGKVLPPQPPYATDPKSYHEKP
ncbi:MAG: hypothetical protein M1815_003356 [Lichina confinis]|nr:MAG: hypothetical protein M1815_003356 [Lichina confinis]